MATEYEIHATVSALNKSGKTFAEFLAELLKDKCVEIYLGDSYEELSTEQVSTSYPAVICGKIVSAYRECLIINSIYSIKNPVKGSSTKNPTSIQTGNILFINERAIRALTEIDGKGVLEQTLLRSRESTAIKEIFENG